MTYIDGFLTPVPSAKREAYRAHALRGAELFRGLGAVRMVECWGDDVPQGKVTDMQRAVATTADEAVVFSWIAYPDKVTRDQANQKLMSGDDDVMAALGDIPFDGKRMVFSGFSELLNIGDPSSIGYLDGYVIPVPQAKHPAYCALARVVDPIFIEHGATWAVENWGDDMMHGEHTDFYRAVAAEDGENIVFSWVAWPDKATRDAGNAKIFADPRFDPGAPAGQPGSMEVPFDGKRMIMGGFTPIIDVQF